METDRTIASTAATSSKQARKSPPKQVAEAPRPRSSEDAEDPIEEEPAKKKAGADIRSFFFTKPKQPKANTKVTAKLRFLFCPPPPGAVLFFPGAGPSGPASGKKKRGSLLPSFLAAPEPPETRRN